MDTLVRLDKCSLGYTDAIVIEALDFTLHTEEKVAILGRSGRGKTTFIKTLIGLLSPKSGRLERYFKKSGYLCQNYTLIDSITALQNIVFVCDNITRAKEMLTLVGMEKYGERFPKELSKGMQKRVELARALSVKPDLLVLDEPFANLDKKSRLELIHITKEYLALHKSALLYVTHDEEEAKQLCDTTLRF